MAGLIAIGGGRKGDGFSMTEQRKFKVWGGRFLNSQGVMTGG